MEPPEAVPAVTPRPYSLRLVQGLAVACHKRSAEAARQCLRALEATLEPAEATQALRQLVGCLDPGERYWLGNLDGPRTGS